jgi:hypothetical protein
MEALMKQALRNLLAFGTAAALSLTVGCAEAGSPTQAKPAATPEGLRDAPLFSQGLAGPDLTRIARFTSKPQTVFGWAKAWIGPQGGRVDFLGFAIQVPAGAVSRVTMFSIRVPLDPYGSDHAVAEFGPHNVAFNKPVQIETPYRNTSADGALTDILWWDESVSQWKSMGGGLTADGLRIKTLVPHFSTYGTSGYEEGTGLMAGGGRM